MTRAEFLKMMGAGAAVLALDAVPGASLIQSANAQTTPLKKNQERLAFGLPDQEDGCNTPHRYTELIFFCCRDKIPLLLLHHFRLHTIIPLK